MNLNIKYINNINSETYIEEKKIEYNGKEYLVPLIKFHAFDKFPWVTAAFSTRLGGCSEGIFESMNLSFSRGDIQQNVFDNHCIMAKALGCSVDSLIYSYQTHTTNVLRVGTDEHGMGITRQRSFGEIDGLTTNSPDTMLITSYADCVPLYFVDPVNKAVSVSHSGWRGTINNMAQATVNKMNLEYGTNPADLVVVIGPSICKDCYEVGEDVASEFIAKYHDSNGVNPVVTHKCTLEDGTKKYYLNLHEANRINMLKASIPEKNIHLTDICTCCNPKLLFSHRASKGQRGGLCGYIGFVRK